MATDSSNNPRKMEITVTGRVNKVVQIGELHGDTHFHSAASDLIGLARRHWAFLFTVIALQIALSVPYFLYHKLYLIPWWYWALAGLLLTGAAWLSYALIWLKEKSGLMRAAAPVLALGLVGMIGWQGYSIAYPQTFEPTQFVIVVAELGEGAAFTRTAHARIFSGHIYEGLCSAINQNFVEAGDADPCSTDAEDIANKPIVVHRIGVIPDSQTAKAIGKRIGADVVVWGQLLTNEFGSTTIRFEVLETADRAINPTFPVLLPVTATSASIVVPEFDVDSEPEAVRGFISEQSLILASFTLGLSSYVERDYPTSARILEAGALQLERAKYVEMSDGGRGLLYYYLGKASYGVGRPEAADEWLRKSAEALPDEPVISISQYSFASIAQDFQAEQAALELSFEQIDKWLDSHPDDPAALYDRAILYQNQQRYPEAVRDLTRVIQIDPDHYVAQLVLGEVLTADGEFGEAEQVLVRAIDLAESRGTDPSWAQVRLAAAYAAAGDADNARLQYLKAIASNPNEAWMRFHYASFCEQQSEMDTALEVLMEMVRLSRDVGWAYGELGAFLQRRGLLEEAADAYREAINGAPDQALNYAYVGETYFALGQTDQALAAFEEAIERGPNHYYVYASYGNMLYTSGDYSQAAQMYEQALGLQAGEPSVMLNLAAAYLMLNRTDEATEVYQQLVMLGDQVPESAVQQAEEMLSQIKRNDP